MSSVANLTTKTELISSEEVDVDEEELKQLFYLSSNISSQITHHRVYYYHQKCSFVTEGNSYLCPEK